MTVPGEAPISPAFAPIAGWSFPFCAQMSATGVTRQGAFTSGTAVTQDWPLSESAKINCIAHMPLSANETVSWSQKGGDIGNRL